MYKPPLRWIEQAEERRFVADAIFERTSSPPWSAAQRETPPQWLPRLGAWFAARHPMGSPVPRLQPALVRQRPRRRRH